MKRIRYFYTIVGERPADLLSPLLDSRFEPGELRLLCHGGNRERAETIAAAARQQGRDAEVHQISHARKTGAMQNDFARWAQSHAPGTAVLNVSGTDPLYAIPACDTFERAGHPVFAVEPDSDWLIWLSTGAGDYASFNIADSLTLPQFLAVHGLQWEGAQQTIRNQNRTWNQASLDIARKARKAPAAIAELNRLACSVNTELVTAKLAKRAEQPQLHDLIDHLIMAGMAERSGDSLRFFGTQERAFAAGGWMEQRLYYAVRPLVLSGKVQDLASGVRVVGPGEMAAEWDVVFLANNNLHIIECKARSAKKASGGIGMEAFFKLESLARLEGLEARPMIATLASPTTTEIARAKQLDIEILVLKDGPHLTAHLERWIDADSGA